VGIFNSTHLKQAAPSLSPRRATQTSRRQGQSLDVLCCWSAQVTPEAWLLRSTFLKADLASLFLGTAQHSKTVSDVLSKSMRIRSMREIYEPTYCGTKSAFQTSQFGARSVSPAGVGSYIYAMSTVAIPFVLLVCVVGSPGQRQRFISQSKPRRACEPCLCCAVCRVVSL
jgi:hypothetical protein